MAKKKITIIDGTGVHEREATAEEIASFEAVIPVATGSAASQRLEKLRAQRGALIEPVEIAGETWFVKRLDWPGIVGVVSNASRDTDGELTNIEENVRLLTIAALAGAVCSGAEDGTRYFTLEEATWYVSEPEAVNLVGDLFDAICRINPDLVPKVWGAGPAPS